jgi:hypothetical protein
MAKTKSKGSALTVHRPSAAGSLEKRKLEDFKMSVAKSKKAQKAAEVAGRRMGALVGVGAAYGVGYLEANGKMPTFPGGIEPTVVLGAVLGFVVPEFVKGKAGQMCAEAGAAVAGVAAYKLAMGAPLRVAGEDEE